MKKIKIFGMLIVCLIITVFIAQPAFSGCNAIAGVSPIPVEKSAAGTKIFGTLTVYLENSDASFATGAKYFLRARKGQEFYWFSGSYSPSEQFLISDVYFQKTAFIDPFFIGTVIPFFYPNCGQANICPVALLKSIDDAVVSFEDGTEFGDYEEGIEEVDFYTLDVTIAVQD